MQAGSDNSYKNRLPKRRCGRKSAVQGRAPLQGTCGGQHGAGSALYGSCRHSSYECREISRQQCQSPGMGQATRRKITIRNRPRSDLSNGTAGETGSKRRKAGMAPATWTKNAEGYMGAVAS